MHDNLKISREIAVSKATQLAYLMGESWYPYMEMWDGFNFDYGAACDDGSEISIMLGE